jgi:hypothetical protein
MRSKASRSGMRSRLNEVGASFIEISFHVE